MKIVGSAVVFIAGILLYHVLQPYHFSDWVQVQVGPGDTEYVIATKECPSANPQSVVKAIEQRNHIDALVKPGEVIWVPRKASK